MRDRSPFKQDDLAELDERLLSRADACIALREVWSGNRGFRTIQMRHDVDDNPGAFDAALAIAKWEAERGYRSTYYLLHTARYFGATGFDAAIREIASMGHEVGIHADALGWCVEHGGDPVKVLEAAIDRLRATGVPVRSVVGHGNAVCPKFGFANDEQFTECARKGMGEPDRMIAGRVRIEPLPLSHYGLDFEAVRLGRLFQLSDSGGEWAVTPFEETCARFPDRGGQLHFLWHPDWWTQAV